MGPKKKKAKKKGQADEVANESDGQTEGASSTASTTKKEKKKKGKGKKKKKPVEDLDTMLTGMKSTADSEWTSKDSKEVNVEAMYDMESTFIGDGTFMGHQQRYVIATDEQLTSLIGFVDRILLCAPSMKTVKILQKGLVDLLERFKVCYAIQKDYRHKIREIQSGFSVHTDHQDSWKKAIAEKELETKKHKENEEIARSETRQISEKYSELELKMELQAEEKAKLQSRIKEMQAKQDALPQIKELRESLLSERESHEAEVTKLRKELSKRESELSDLSDKSNDIEFRASNFESKYTQIKGDWQLEVKNRIRSEKESFELRQNLKEQEKEIKTFISSLNTTKHQYWAASSSCKKYEEELKKCRKVCDAAIEVRDRLKQRFEQSTAKLLSLTAQHNSLSKKAEGQAEEMAKLKQEVVKLRRLRIEAMVKLTVLTLYKKNNEGKIKGMKAKLEALKKENESLSQKNAENEDLVEEFDVISSELMDQIVSLKLFNKEMKSYVDEDSERKQLLKHQVMSLNARLDLSLKKVNDMKKTESDLLRSITELTSKCNRQEKQVEDIVASEKSLDRELLETTRKLATEVNQHKVAKSKLDDYKTKFMKTENKCSELRDEVQRLNSVIEDFSKEGGDNKGELNYKKMEISMRRLVKERFSLLRKLEIQKAQSEKMKESDGHEESLKRLNKEVNTKNVECFRLQRQIEILRNGNSSLKSDLNDREQLLKKLEEKIDIQNKLLGKGVKDYEQRVSDIKLLKRELTYAVRVKNVLEKEVAKMTTVRKELVQTSQDLFQEKMRVKGLETELQHPTNVHRWRMLEGNDPEQHQLLTKNQYLQKRLMNSMMLVDKQSKELQDYKRQIQHLKGNVNQQAVLQDIASYGQDYKTEWQKAKEKCNALTAQVNMYESICTKYQAENRDLRNRLSQYMRFRPNSLDTFEQDDA